MKQSFTALLLMLPLVFSSCLGGSSSEPDPMAPGIAIYSIGVVKSQISMIQTDVAMRLAILVASAEEGEDPLELEDGSGLLRDRLFANGVDIRCVDGVYTFNFPSQLYYYSGEIVVDTNGNKLSTYDDEWTVTSTGLKATIGNGYSSTTYTFSSGTTTIIYGDGDYDIQLSDFSASSTYDKLLDGWGGSFTLEPLGGSLAFASAQTENFRLNGQTSDSEMLWKVSNLFYQGASQNNAPDAMQLNSGEITVSLLGTYDAESYPSPKVVVNWSNNGQSYTIEYNGLRQSN